MSASEAVRQVAHSDQMTALARWGLAARAAIYLLLGSLTLLVAFGDYRRETDQRGALQELTRHTGGTVLLWIIFVGLVGYALWRFSEAAFGVVGEGRKVGPRVKSFGRGCIYLLFAGSAFSLVTHSGQQSQAGQQQLWTAKALAHSGGRWAVGVLGAVVVVCGLALLIEGVTRRFEKNLATDQMSDATRSVVEVLGVVGTTARGVVFAMAGLFTVQAARTYNPAKARGLDGALRQVAAASGGRWLLVAVAAGLVAFGLFGFAEAKWRRT